MKIAREQKPGVGKEKKKKKEESHGNSFQQEASYSRPTSYSAAFPPKPCSQEPPNSIWDQQGKTRPLDELPSSNATLEEEAMSPCSISLAQGERLWSCSYTKVTLTDMHSSDTVSYCWTKRYTVLGDVAPRINSSLQHSEQDRQRV